MLAHDLIKAGLKPLARILAHTTHSQHPSEFTCAPVGAISKLFEKIGWTKADVDLFEINEAFAMVTLMHALKQNGKKNGIASLCIGGGEATAMAIEML